MKAEEYLKENDLPNPVIIKRGITKQTLNIVLYMSELMEDYAEKEAIEFIQWEMNLDHETKFLLNLMNGDYFTNAYKKFKDES